MIKICDKCEQEFEVSKFNPYFTQCKSCRKGGCKSTLNIQPKKKKKKNNLSCQRCKDHLLSSQKTGIWKCPLCRNVYTIIKPKWYKIWDNNGSTLSNKVYYLDSFKGFHTEYGDLRRMINEHEKTVN